MGWGDAYDDAPNGLDSSDVMSAHTHVAEDEDEHPNLLRQIRENKPKVIPVKDAMNFHVKHTTALDEEKDGRYGEAPEERASAIKNPIIVAHSKGKHYVLDGQHRLATAIKEGHSHIPAVIADVPEMKDHLADNFGKLRAGHRGLKKGDLFKGARGDWKAEGYEIYHQESFEDGSDREPGTEFNPKIHGFTVHARDPKTGESPAYMFASHAIAGPNKGALYSTGTYIDKDHQRKGLATAMYQYAEKLSGKKMIPSGGQTNEAKAFWQQPNRPFGNKMKKGELEAKKIQSLGRSAGELFKDGWVVQGRSHAGATNVGTHAAPKAKPSPKVKTSVSISAKGPAASISVTKKEK